MANKINPENICVISTSDEEMKQKIPELVKSKKVKLIGIVTGENESISMPYGLTPTFDEVERWVQSEARRKGGELGAYVLEESVREGTALRTLKISYNAYTLNLQLRKEIGKDFESFEVYKLLASQ